MIRNTPIKPINEIQYDIENEPIIFYKSLMDHFLPYDNPADLVALYIFYYYTAKWQKTNQPKATVSYVKNAYNWGEHRVRKARKILKELGLIQDIRVVNQNNKVVHWYVKVNFIWSKATLTKNGGVETIATLTENHPVANDKVNALSLIILNALNTNNLKKKKKKEFFEIKEFIKYLPKEFIKNKKVYLSIKEFIKFRQEEKKSPLTSRSIKIICNQFKNKPPNELKECIETSIMSGWKGIFPKKEFNGYNKNNNNNKPAGNRMDQATKDRIKARTIIQDY